MVNLCIFPLHYSCSGIHKGQLNITKLSQYVTMNLVTDSSEYIFCVFNL